MANIRGTNLSAAVVPFTTEDSYATHCAKYGQGGWRTVESYEDLNTIADDRLEQGMAVYVNALEKVYILSNLDLSVNPVVKIWTELETGGGGSSASTVQLTLDSSDWDSTTHEQTIQNITGLEASSIIVVIPAPNSMTDYMAANILCTSQATEELTFMYTGIAPINNVIVNILIM